jgi:signal transduction histidine kinase
MMDRLDLTPYPIKPHRIIAILLCVSFASEFLVMQLLPLIVPQGSSKTLEAAIDSCLLSLMLAPALWFGIVRPIQRLSESRMLFLRRSILAQEAERRRIKGELHDGLGQTLTSLQLGLRALEETTKEHQTVDGLKQLRKIGASIHEELRRLVAGLHPTVLDQGGLIEAISSLIAEFRVVSKVEIEQKTTGFDRISLDKNFETTVYRIVQEALVNSVKHSQATHIVVDLELRDSTLTVMVQDNGTGFPVDQEITTSRNGFGLVGLRERAMSMGGHVEINSSKLGTRISAKFPISRDFVQS